jgi:hypothetical protein
MSISPRLGLSYILPQQAQKHVSANESFRRLDTLVQMSAKSASLAVEPASPAEGDAYILPASPSGANWDAMTGGSIAAYQDGQWTEYAAREGWRSYVEDAAAFFAFNGAGWIEEASSGLPASVPSLGINTSADATNKFAVKSDALMLSHDDVTPGTGNARQVISKSAAEKTASVVFQNNFAGRAEFGLCGDDDFKLKVSADGAAWKDALVIDKASAFVGAGGAPLAQFHLFGIAGSNPAEGDFHIQKEDGYAVFLLTEYSSLTAFNSGFSVQRRARGTAAAPAAVQSGDWLGGFSFRGYSPAGIFEQRALINALVDAAPSGASVPSALVFQTGTAALGERMRITSGGDVGIGAASPTTKLDVDGPVRVKSYVKTSLPSAAGSGAGAIVYVSNEAGGAVIAFSDGSNWRRVTDRAVVS